MATADEKVEREKLPEPVLNSLQKLSPGYTFSSANKMTQQGADRYQVNVKNQEKALRFVLAANGDLQETWDMNPKLADAPAAAKKLIVNASGEAPDMLVKIQRSGAKPFYRFRVTRSVTADGTVSEERSLGDRQLLKKEELPAPVLNAFQKLLPGSEWFAVKLSGDDAPYGLSYEIRARQGTKFYWYIFSPEGTVKENWDLNLHVADLPERVAKVVERATSGGEREPENLIKVMPVGKDALYMYRITRDVSEDGAVLPKSDD